MVRLVACRRAGRRAANLGLLFGPLALLVLCAACPKEGGGGGAGEAKQVFEQRCVSCHGARGLGDGPAAASLNPKPRSFSDKAWQKTATDEAISKIIVEGGAAVGKSPLMPGNPDMRGKPELVKGLLEIVRAFGK